MLLLIIIDSMVININDPIHNNDLPARDFTPKLIESQAKSHFIIYETHVGDG